jgi:DNA-binding MarR family transcriptional regulator
MSTDLRTEIKQRAPFRSGEEEAFLNLLRTSALLEHAAASFLKEHGLTLTQYNALRILRGAGPEGLCRNEVSERMVKPVTDATRLLDRMASAGWVKRVREDGDRRVVTARITQSGLDLLAALDSEVTHFHQKQLGHMSRPDLTELTRLLSSARAHS